MALIAGVPRLWGIRIHKEYNWFKIDSSTRHSFLPFVHDFVAICLLEAKEEVWIIYSEEED